VRVKELRKTNGVVNRVAEYRKYKATFQRVFSPDRVCPLLEDEDLAQRITRGAILIRS